MYAECRRFGERVLSSDEIAGKQVLEVGSRNVNGTYRDIVQGFEPAYYLGIDIVYGPGVDCICDVLDLFSIVEPGAFDMVICTEVLEHIFDWRKAILNMKLALKPGGILVLTTLAPGFPKHDYPGDYWRWSFESLSEAFDDFEVLVAEVGKTPFGDNGLYIKARKPIRWIERPLEDIEAISI